ncbi:DEAD/DEAH box helicase [Campylobacter canadensis]|uniref:DEAD/DEAH box helicase n=1 Tax=Campylobacter canadensis TaxID=449520 RepID=UPI0015577670|nr:DEAD/DEAH box helicase [Campylobacter canadensis]MBZ7994083.1 DEAD/DEAH box helicase [Campylobacter canadensis]MBZ7995914.1 DEAD/DEAH box helicase [Campylobacter canadensis]MBZ7999414.1 DEAD/DEAH box helicase [Campylobacter canadensis]MBZ8001211.1 DEAD/DEAH box helicase [Campylobacter canadensis]MBZ8003740.1 DEAD/DEAH box helicase [Campylobacter canadensis]
MQADLFEYLNSKKSCELFICEDLNKAYNYSYVFEYFNIKSFVLPDFRAEENDDLRSFLDELISFSNRLYDFYNCKEKKVLISPVASILHKLPNEQNLKPIKLEFAQSVNKEELFKMLKCSAYSLVDSVSTKAEFCIKNEKIDIFCINYENPIRIVFFDNEIESIKFYDINTGLSFKDELLEIDILPIISRVEYDFFEQINNECSELDEYLSVFFWKLKLNDLLDYYSHLCSSNFLDFSNRLNNILSPAKKYKDCKVLINNDFFKINSQKNITLLASNENKFLEFSFGENVKKVISPAIINISSNDEYIISLNKKEYKQRKIKASLNINELNKNDFIVHEKYGIGKFIGLELIKTQNTQQEFIKILYANDDKLLLPTNSLHLIDKYVASSIPVLDKLGKNTFVKLKEKLKTKLFAIANSICELAAKRALIKAKSISIPLEYEIFKNAVDFSLTPDQQKAINDIFCDMQKSYPMDRLLSADVGFGKTEVAMHAIFACVKNNYNALFFAPTTLLCAQHYNTLKERFKDYDIDIFRLDRYSNTKSKILASKKAKIIIGTHSLLSLELENVALIVVDEEHKFGVKHKEKLKQLCLYAHQLSMSATPIPRTLNQALSTLKSYSCILTPPLERLDVRSFVKIYDDALIKEIIARELRRKGQIFYIHNHIASIEYKKRYLQDLFPKLKILVLHSKVDNNTAQEQMLAFMNKEYDLLLSTSIVESGIDLQNANTIIIENANRFGIADLHQLRGRVGRSNIQGFCYYLIDNDEISEDAKKRLLSLESNSYLGSGHMLAQMDLELRGGGNLLGAEQSGHIEQLGYALYIKMLEEQINLLSKNESKKQDFEQKLLVNAYISDELVSNEKIRLNLYRRLNECKNMSELSNFVDEFSDSFSKPDEVSNNYFKLIAIKIKALEQNIIEISNFDSNIRILYADKKSLVLKANSKNDSDILNCVLEFLNKKN